MGRAIHPRAISHTTLPASSSCHRIAFLCPWHKHKCLFCYCQQLIPFPLPKAGLINTSPFKFTLARGTAGHLSSSSQTRTLPDWALQTTAYTLENGQQAVTRLLLLPRCWTLLSLCLCQNGWKAAGTGILCKPAAGSAHQVSSDLWLGDCTNICNCSVSMGFISPLTKIPQLLSFIESWSSF